VAREADHVPRILDVGGGFGVPYTDERPAEPEAIATLLTARLRELAREAGWPLPELRVEPGRWMAANPGCTIYTVLGRTTAGGRELVAVDGGMSDNLRPMLYDARHAVAPASAADGPRRAMTVVGRHCESGDVLAHDVELPEAIGPGDLLAVAATGAYAYPMASVYNRFGRPAVVAVHDGRAVPWLRREDAADMDRLEVAAPRAVAGVDAHPRGVDVRPARPADARAFLTHWDAVVREGGFLRTERNEAHPAQVRRRFRGSWSSEEANVLAFADGEVVGSIGLTRERHPATRHVATLGMAVSPGYRRRGVGAALLTRGFGWAREQGVAKLVLSVFPDNTGAIALYRRFGFVEEGRLARHARTAAGARDEILMAAWIEGDA
jgi:RimJ/RimL family protein N-acetyltransferase